MNEKKNNQKKISDLYERASKLKDLLNQMTNYSEPIQNELIIAEIPKEKKELIDSMDKMDLLEYSLNGSNLIPAKSKNMKDSISISNLDYSTDNNNNDSLDIKKFNNLNINFKNLVIFKDIFNLGPQIINKDDIIYLETKIPMLKGTNGETLYDTFKIYSRVSGEKDEKDNQIVNINQNSIHKLDLENNFSTLTSAKIFVFIHKIVSPNNNNKNINNGGPQKKNKSTDTIIGYCNIDLNNIFLAKEFKLKVDLDVIAKELVQKKKNNFYNGRKTRGNSPKEEVEYKNIGKLNIFFGLTKQGENLKENQNKKDENKNALKQFMIANNNNNNNNNENVISSNNNINSNDNVQELKTDLYDDILILILKINDLKVANSFSYSSNNVISTSNNNNMNMNNGNTLIPLNLNRNYFIMHKIFPDMSLVTTDIFWNETNPNFNYFVQMPFTLNQETAELLDNNLFIIEIWNKGKDDDELIGTVKLDLRNILDSMKVDDNTITTKQLYKNKFPYVIYNDYFPVEMYENSPNMFLKICMGIGTPVQVNSYLQNMKKENNNNIIINSNFEEEKKNHSININNNENANNNTKSLNPFQEKNENNNNNDFNNNLISQKPQEHNIFSPENNNYQQQSDYFQSNENLHQEPQQQINNFQSSQNFESQNNFVQKYDMNVQTDDINISNEENKSISRAAEINVDDLFEKNKKEIDNLNNKYNLQMKDTFKKSTSSNFDFDKKDVVNPFLVPEVKEKESNSSSNKKDTAGFNKNTENVPQQQNVIEENTQNDFNPLIQSENVNNFNNVVDNVVDNVVEHDFSKSENPKKESSTKNIYINIETPPQEIKIYHNDNNNNNNKKSIENKKSFKIQNLETHNIKREYSRKKEIPLQISNNDIFINNENNNENNNEINNENNNEINNEINNKEETDKNNILIEDNNINITNEPHPSNLTKHIFTINIEKIINCQIISKINSNCYLKYKFFTDQNPIRSESFTYSQFSVDSSIIEIEMSSSHSIILPNSEKLKDYLNDFLIEICYNDENQCKTIGKVSIPVDEFYYLISNDSNNILNRMIFIYGTENIQRNKCIIGKIKLNINYENERVFDNNNFNSDIYLEKETIFNRKIPKKSILKFYIKNFKSENLFEEYYKKNFYFNFIFSPFGEITKMEKIYGKRISMKKYNVLNAEFNENLTYKLEMDQNLIEYFKCRNGFIFMQYKLAKNNNIENDENENDTNFDLIDLNNHKNIIGKGIFSLNEILTSADVSKQNTKIFQIGNDSGILGTLNFEISLENDINGMENNTVSNLYKNHNKKLFSYDPCLYLNGKFLFVIDFTKFFYEINSKIGSYLVANNNNFYLVFKFGNKIKKISPKFSSDSNDNFDLNANNRLIILNYTEMIEMNLNFKQKLPNDLYNQFNEGIFEIKMYQNEYSNCLGSFYIDLNKLINSKFYSENILYSGNNILNLIDENSNKYLQAKIELNIGIFKLNSELINNNNFDYSLFYQNLFRKDFSESLINNFIQINDFNDINVENANKIFFFNEQNMFNFINENVIDLFDVKGNVDLNEFKKIFNLITKLNFDIFNYYNNNNIKNNIENIFEYYLSNNVTNFDNEDLNILNYLKNRKNNISLNINNNNINNNDFDKISFCMFLFDYEMFFNKNFIYSLKNNNNNNNFLTSNINIKSYSKIMYVSIISGLNIVKPNSELNERPNCYFILEFDDKNYRSDIVMNTSQPNFNEDLEIKINAEEYINKLNSLPIIINLFSFNENDNIFNENNIFNNNFNDVFIGRCEIFPHKLFPFLNDNNEIEDFFHIVNENGKVSGQLNVKIKFDPEVINSMTNKSINNNFNSINYNLFNNNYSFLNKRELNQIQNNKYNTMNLDYNNNFYNENDDEYLKNKLIEAMNTCDNLTLELKKKTMQNTNFNFQNFNSNFYDNFNNSNFNNNNNQFNFSNLNNNNNNFNNSNLILNNNYNNNNNINFNNSNISNNNNNNFYDNNNNNYNNNNFNNSNFNNSNNNLNNSNNSNNNNNNLENKSNSNIFSLTNENINNSLLTEQNKNKIFLNDSLNNNNSNKNSFYSDSKEISQNKKINFKNIDKKLLNRIEKIIKKN